MTKNVFFSTPGSTYLCEIKKNVRRGIASCRKRLPTLQLHFKAHSLSAVRLMDWKAGCKQKKMTARVSNSLFSKLFPSFGTQLPKATMELNLFTCAREEWDRVTFPAHKCHHWCVCQSVSGCFYMKQVVKIYPLGTMNICTKFHGNLSNS